jgi:hypothetical protein
MQVAPDEYSKVAVSDYYGEKSFQKDEQSNRKKTNQNQVRPGQIR